MIGTLRRMALTLTTDERTELERRATSDERRATSDEPDDTG